MHQRDMERFAFLFYAESVTEQSYWEGKNDVFRFGQADYVSDFLGLSCIT